MIGLFVFIAAFAPGLFWLVYFYKQDRWEPEPKRLVLRTFLYGLIAAVPIALIEVPFRAWGTWATAVVGAPIVEECGKYFVVRRTIYPSREFDEVMDGMVYAAAAALGLASIENALYVVESYGKAAREPDVSLGYAFIVFGVRAILSVPGHVFFSGMWGYALGVAKFTRSTAHGRAVVAVGLACSIVAHAAFNLVAMTAEWGALLLFAFVPILWRITHRRIRRSLALSPYADKTPGEHASEADV